MGHLGRFSLVLVAACSGDAATTQPTTDASAEAASDASRDASPDVIGSDAFVGDGGFQPKYPGQPPRGTVLWGAAINGNGDPIARHETPSGHPLSVHRTYFVWTQRSGAMVTMAKDDISHHRVPWVSVKPPSWAAMGAGTYDAEIDDMLTALGTVPGPVWLAVHHEPEGGGGSNTPDDPSGAPGHLAMNGRVRMRMTALGIKNVALAPILMSYTWLPASNRNAEDWWKPGIYDFVGIDHYRDAEASLLTPTWSVVRTWAQAKGVDIAVGEWGMRGIDAAAGLRVHEWYDSAAGSNADGKGARVVGLCAFDSGLNAPTGSWVLVGEQLTAFQSLLGDPRTANVVP